MEVTEGFEPTIAERVRIILTDAIGLDECPRAQTETRTWSISHGSDEPDRRRVVNIGWTAGHMVKVQVRPTLELMGPVARNWGGGE